jgi:hypothetical protein
MAKFCYNADASDVPEFLGERSPLVVGKDQPVRATSYKMMENASGWEGIQWEFEFTGGPNEGRKHWELVTIKNANGYVVKPDKNGNPFDPAIAGQRTNNQFAAAIKLTGADGSETAANDPDNYLMKPVLISINRRKPYVDKSGIERTDDSQIGYFKSANGVIPARATPASSASSAGTQAPTSSPTPPWKR